MGSMHAQVYSALPNARVAGIVDENVEATRKKLKEMGLDVPVYPSLKEGLQAHLMQRVAEPAGLNLDTARLCYLVTKAGADAVFAADKMKVSDELLQRTHQHGIDVVLEMSGNPHAINDALRSLKLGGHVVMMGIPKGNVELNLSQDITFKKSRR